MSWNLSGPSLIEHTSSGQGAPNYRTGDEALAGDECTTVRTYVPNTGAYIVGLTSDASLYSDTAVKSGNLIKQTLYYQQP